MAIVVNMTEHRGVLNFHVRNTTTETLYDFGVTDLIRKVFRYKDTEYAGAFRCLGVRMVNGERQVLYVSEGPVARS